MLITGKLAGESNEQEAHYHHLAVSHHDHQSQNLHKIAEGPLAVQKAVPSHVYKEHSSDTWKQQQHQQRWPSNTCKISRKAKKINHMSYSAGNISHKLFF